MSNFKIIQSLRNFFGIEMAFENRLMTHVDFYEEKKDEKKFSDVINNSSN